MHAPRLAVVPFVALLAFATGCAPASPDPEGDDPSAETHEARLFAGSPAEDAADTGAARCGDGEPADTGSVCADEGEACEAYDDGTSDCCNGRHTCFVEGCYYTQP